jgi:beta-lactamase class A
VKLRLSLACLAVAAVIGFGGCGFGAPKSAAPSHTDPASATAAVSLLPPTASPTATPAPTDPPLQQAWTNQAVALTAEAQKGGAAQVHLGAGFPLALTSRTAQVDGAEWVEATWQTPGRKGTGWLPSAAVTTTKPSGGASASFDALDSGLSDYLNDLGTKVGVQVLDVTRGMTYSFNADKQFLVASSMKVPIMLTKLSQLEARKKKPTAAETSLMTSMIEHSNNKSATELYKDIGWERGIKNFMKGVGIAGLNPAPTTTGWGYSTTSPAAMVQLLARLNAGTILNKADRDFALKLMGHIQADQRVGVGDSSPAGAIVQMKDGWIDIDDTASGPYVVNSSGIVSKAGETYVISIYTIRDRNTSVGFAIVRHVALVVGQKLMGAS